MTKLKDKNAKDSEIESTYLVLPEHTNAMGNIFGGTIMAWIDMIASIVAFRHCRNIVVTASMDDLSFLHPVKLGDLVILKSKINFTSKRSIEVGVKVVAENPITGEQKHTSSAYLIFVSLDKNGKAIEVPQIIPESDCEKQRFEEGKTRRENRLKKRK